MQEFLCNSVTFGVVLTIAAYWIGMVLKKHLKLAIFNPIFIGVVLVMIFLVCTKTDYRTYYGTAKYLDYLLTPATVCFAVPLYEQLSVLKKNIKAVIVGVISGVLTSMLCIVVCTILFRFDHVMYVTLLPKSITSAVGMAQSELMGGIPTLTVAVIVVTGIFGNMIAETVCRVFRITEPVAKGIGIGSASHAGGTAKAMEMGQVEGAMSSLSIVLSGIITVLATMVFSRLL